MSSSGFKDMVGGIDFPVVQMLALIGGLVLVRSALCVLTALYTTFLRPGKNLKKYGAWAVITGATGERARERNSVLLLLEILGHIEGFESNVLQDTCCCVIAALCMSPLHRSAERQVPCLGYTKTKICVNCLPGTSSESLHVACATELVC